MFSQGWKLDCTKEEITIDKLQSSITYCLKRKLIKEKRTPKIPSEKKARSSVSIIYVDEEILKSTIGGSSTKIKFVDPKVLEKEEQKALKSDTRGMEKYSRYFPFKYKEFEILVDQCWLAPYHYNSCQVEPSCVDACMLFFGASANRPSTCAYLMPIKEACIRKGIPMKLSEVKEERLTNYSYWIIDGQHSIYASKILRYQEIEKDSCSEELVAMYEKRKTQIVVDLEPQVITAIFAIANEEAQALYVKQPYSDILKHLRSQWIFNKSPSKPAHGVIEGSTSRTSWDVCKYPLLTYNYLLNFLFTFYILFSIFLQAFLRMARITTRT